MLCRFLFDEYGYDQVDWNLGCPIRSIVSKKRGSGLLPYPSIIDTLLEKIIPGIPQQLSVKVRMGLNSTSEFPPLIEVLNRHPLSRVIVHARLGIQQYEGEILLEEFAGFLPLISHEVVFNGDIHNFDDFTSISTRLPNVRNFMIGRGILYNPFLTEMIRGSCKQLPEGWHTRFREYYYELENAMKINRKFWMSKMKEY
jgi:tRNA-dihydrouridine synthase